MAPKQSKRTWGPSIFFPKAVLGHDVCFYFILSVSIAFTFYCKLDVISAQKCRCRNACYFISLYPGWAAAETCSKKSRAYPRTYTRGLADGIPMALLFMMVQQTPSLDASMGFFFIHSFIYFSCHAYIMRTGKNLATGCDLSQDGADRNQKLLAQ